MNNLKSLAKTNTLQPFLLTFLLPLAVYVFSASSSATGFADSDELITAAAVDGVAHPSGYPLATSLIGIAIKLSPLKPSHTANLLAGLLHAATVYLVYQIILILLTQKNRLAIGSDKKAYLAAVSGSLLLAFSGLFWLYASVIEVVSFTSLYLALTLLLALKTYFLAQKGAFSPTHYLMTWTLAGLGLSHVPTLILLFPSLAILLIAGYRRLKLPVRTRIGHVLKGLLVGLIAFLLPLIIMWFDNASAPPFSWYFPPDLQGIVNFITRQDYAGYYLEADVTRNSYIDQLNARLITSQPHLITFYLEHLGIVGIILAAIGFRYTIKHFRRPELSAILVGFVFTGPILAGVMGITDPQAPGPDTAMLTGVLQRQLLNSQIFLAIAIGLGVFYLYKKLNSLGISPAAYKASALAIILLVGYQTYAKAPLGIQRDNHLVEAYATSALLSADPGSVILCTGDISCFSFLHASLVDRIRPDVTVLTKNTHYRRWFLSKNPQYYGLLYSENPDFFAGLLAVNHLQRTTYLTLPDVFYFDYIGFDGNPFYLIPRGLLFQVTADRNDAEPSLSSEAFYTKLASHKTPPFDYFSQGVKQYFAGLYRLQGLITTQLGYPDLSEENFSRADSLDPLSAQISIPAQALPKENSSATKASAQNYLDQALEARQRQQFGTTYDLLRKASYLNPRSDQIRVELAEHLLEHGYLNQAGLELRHALLFNPDNQTARDLLLTTF